MRGILVHRALRTTVVLATAWLVVAIPGDAQEVRRGGGKQQQQKDPRVRDSGYSGPQAPPPISGKFMGIHAKGGFIVQDSNDQTGVVATDRVTEVIVRGEADPSFVTPGCMVELTGTLEGPKGPLTSNFLVVVQSMARNTANNPRFQPYFNYTKPMPGDTKPVTASIRGQVASLNPLVVNAQSAKILINVEQPAQVQFEVIGGDPRVLCKEGDRVDVVFQALPRRDAMIAQVITITRSDPWNAVPDEKGTKEGKKKEEGEAAKQTKPAKGKAAAKGKEAKQPGEEPKK